MPQQPTLDQLSDTMNAFAQDSAVSVDLRGLTSAVKNADSNDPGDINDISRRANKFAQDLATMTGRVKDDILQAASDGTPNQSANNALAALKAIGGDDVLKLKEDDLKSAYLNAIKNDIHATNPSIDMGLESQGAPAQQSGPAPTASKIDFSKPIGDPALDKEADLIGRANNPDATRSIGDVKGLITAEKALASGDTQQVKQILDQVKTDLESWKTGDNFWIGQRNQTEQHVDDALKALKAGNMAEVRKDIEKTLHGHLDNEAPNTGGMTDVIRGELLTGTGDKGTAAALQKNVGTVRMAIGNELQTEINDAIKDAEGKISGGHAQLNNPTASPVYKAGVSSQDRTPGASV